MTELAARRGSERCVPVRVKGRPRLTTSSFQRLSFIHSINPNRVRKIHAPVSHMVHHVLCDQAAGRSLQACHASQVSREGALSEIGRPKGGVAVGWVESPCETHHLLRVRDEATGIAEFIIGRAFVRPVGSTHPTGCCYRPKICWIASAFSCTALLARITKIGTATSSNKIITRRVRLTRRLGRLVESSFERSWLFLTSITSTYANPARRRPCRIRHAFR
jgi:hypothetical protein